MKVLLLGGTAEARELARHLVGHDAVYSLAGATEKPAIPGLSTRIGGFGGVAGLVKFLRAGGFTHVIDATHPFAAQMKRNVDLAVADTAIDAIHLIRPAWELDEVARAADLDAAARTLKSGSRVLLALGSRHSETFQSRKDVAFWVRSIDEKIDQGSFTYITGKPPFSVEEEKATFQKYGIDTLVMRDSGGAEGLAKLFAARQVGLRVVVVDRPVVPQSLVVKSVQEVLQWLAAS